MDGDRPGWWGGRRHRGFTVVVFVVLASLDNTALALMPPLIRDISRDLGVGETPLGLLTASVILVTAVTAVFWGYWGDRAERKPLLFGGTLLWSAGMAASTTATSFPVLAAWQCLAAVGLGAIASVGFSVVSDLVSPARRGLAMSFWGIAQGIGSWAALILVGVTVEGGWRGPFLITALAGGTFALLYLTTYSPPRGAKEPTLARILEEGGTYDHQIERDHVPELLRHRTNRWLILQGFTAQIAYGSLIWISPLFQAKVEALGHAPATADAVGALMVAVVQLGALFSILAGHVGDRLQRRTLRARAAIGAVGILGAVPFFLATFLLPLHGLEIPEGATGGGAVTATLGALVSSPWVAAVFAVALVAQALTAADSPNWYALIADVNLPEHRGTVFGLGNLSNGIGRAAGNGLTGVTLGALSTALPPPTNYVASLCLFQVFFLPTGWCYWRAARTSPGDIHATEATLAARAADARPGG